MKDPNVLVRAWLLTPSLVIDGVTVQNQVPVLLNQKFTPGAQSPNDTPDRVYGAKLPPGFDPIFGPGIVVKIGAGSGTGTSGGSSHPEAPLSMPRMYLTAWAGVNQFDVAREIYGAAYDWIQRRNNIDLGDLGYIFKCSQQVDGQDIDDPHTGFSTVMGIWALMLEE